MTTYSYYQDAPDEITQIVAANIGYDILALMAKTPLTA